MSHIERLIQRLVIAALLWQVAQPAPARAQRFDPAPAWPLCGRITEDQPRGWHVFDGCPASRWGNPDAADLPLSSTFGPRQKASEAFRYDYHRGIDIPTAVYTPVFAITAGQVVLAGESPVYEDLVVQLRHHRPGKVSCAKVGCYHSNYIHMSRVVVTTGQWVEKGQLVGFSGVSVSGFSHLHFEIREAPWFDPFSNWQRDAIHPLHVLPYRADSAPAIVFDRVDTRAPDRPKVGLTVSAQRLDIVRVELTLYDERMEVVPQPGNTLDERGYNAWPSWFDMDEWNFQYSHKDTAAWPWSRFAEGGSFACPYHEDHGPEYSPNVHLDRALPGQPTVGAFNGVILAPARHSVATEHYVLRIVFEELSGPAHCIEARVMDTSGGEHLERWGQCVQVPGAVSGPDPAPPAPPA